MVEFRMPSLGADMEAGTLVEWLAAPGDRLKPGDVIAVVETDKGAIEIEVFEAGVLDRYLVEPGVKLAVGTPLALIRADSEAGAAQPAPPAPAAAPAVLPPPPPAPTSPIAQPAAGAPAARVRASPAARRLAELRGVDLGRVTGTGPGGVVQRADVEAVAQEPPAKAEGFDFAPMRRAIAAAMSRSKREIPHYYLADTIDGQPALDWVTRFNVDRPPEQRVLLGALFVKAAALAARAYPEFNGVFENEVFRPVPAIHVGMAITIRGGGLVAPAIHDAADLDLPTLMSRMRDLVGRVRAGRFRSSEIADPTITVSSLGDRGVETLYGVVYPPQVAIVGFGRIVQRPWVIGDQVVPRAVVTITLAADHRVSDGHRGALFLADIGRRLQQPEAL